MQNSVLMPTEGKTIAVGSHTVRYLQRDPQGGYALIEWRAPPAIPGPPLHIHHRTDEGFYVLEGTFGFQSGERVIHGPAGAYVFVRRGLPHTYWNDGPNPARVLILISPPDFAPYFEALSARLAAAGDSVEAAIRVRQALSAEYDIEVVGLPRRTP